MSLPRNRLLLVLLPVMIVPAFAMDHCGTLERRLEAQASTISVSADELGAFRSLGEAALAAVKTCPYSARLWYFAARSAEVLESEPGDSSVFSAYGGAEKIALQAAAQVPQSVAIATVLARLDESAASARRAYKVDPSYGPARRAFALALGREGKFQEAMKLVTPPAGSEDRLTRAKLLLSAHLPKQAAAEAIRALRNPQPDRAELAPSNETVREGDETLGFALMAEGRTDEALRAFRIAASAGSRAAQAELSKRR